MVASKSAKASNLRRTRTSLGFAARLTGAADTSMGAKRAEARVAEKRMAN